MSKFKLNYVIIYLCGHYKFQRQISTYPSKNFFGKWHILFLISRGKNCRLVQKKYSASQDIHFSNYVITKQFLFFMWMADH